MVLGPLSVVAAATLYHGVRESVKYLYIPPAIRSRIENYDWETYRFRMPSPGNDLINNEKAARELHKDHFKASYHLSTYYVRGIT